MYLFFLSCTTEMIYDLNTRLITLPEGSNAWFAGTHFKNLRMYGLENFYCSVTNLHICIVVMFWKKKKRILDEDIRLEVEIPMYCLLFIILIDYMVSGVTRCWTKCNWIWDVMKLCHWLDKGGSQKDVTKPVFLSFLSEGNFLHIFVQLSDIHEYVPMWILYNIVPMLLCIPIAYL